MFYELKKGWWIFHLPFLYFFSDTPAHCVCKYSGCPRIPKMRWQMPLSASFIKSARQVRTPDTLDRIYDIHVIRIPNLLDSQLDWESSKLGMMSSIEFFPLFPTDDNPYHQDQSSMLQADQWLLERQLCERFLPLSEHTCKVLKG